MNANAESFCRQATLYGLALLSCLVLCGCAQEKSSESQLPEKRAQEKPGQASTSTDEAKAAKVVVDIKALAGSSPAEVAGILGAPSKTATTKVSGRSFPQHTYKSGRIEVVFIEGVADLITVYRLEELPFSAAALEQLGLESRSPTFSNQFVKRWNNIPGIRELSLFPDGGRVDYAYVVVRTSP